ncbi:uncharacterized protein DUF2017 [Solirubrobacter pauli]|uniref:Uncharacterized protein DUF2017 n=1 Tax=Solirubrobacter pauli TaxID=166793 RepID=A0A660L8R5_9ACTN|nr:DUF2017 family protein [Solirubrobacter pauli]RKQ90776.1 uncharacterized protein DUF2017 [Solirubrobacter pauli]
MRRIDKRQGKFLLTMEPQERELIRQLLDELRELLALSPDDPRVRRLYPSAYAEDVELENEYRSLTRDELHSGRLASIDAVEATVDAELLDLDQLTAWMQAVNSLRLVLGTMLDINDDDDELSFNPEDPNARTVALYGYLGGLLDEIVDAQLSD